ncbi:MAG: serine/threonine-protein kinase, partial [Anaerolineae bacterium]
MLETQFGKYRIDGIAGIGGMSVVYRAYDETLERDVALKILNAQRAADEVGLRRFQREVHIAQRLTHPNIVTIYETGEVDSRAYLAMEYFPEGSLAKHFAKPVEMTLGTSAMLLREIASALDYAHANGVVHRDLKLENVLISEDGHVALSDFGIAQIVSMSSLTETGQSFGTPLYVSPEQLQGAKNVDFRTDLYSLGVIAYLLATGYFPFSGESGVAILHSHLVYDPPLPSNLNPRLPTQMDWVLNKSLAKNPQDRFASAGALADAFAGAISRVADVEVVILANQPTPIIPAGGTPIRNGAGEPGGMDTVPIDAMTGSLPPPRSSRSLRFRVAAGLAALVVISLVLLGLSRALIPPPNSTGDQSATVNPLLA